ncbi:MAG: L-seryl-tRNA(Sec) selenium transferase [candidate division Zixibacteria bacterium]
MANKSSKKLRLSQFPSISSILEDARLKPLFEKWSFVFVSSEVKKLAAVLKKMALKEGKIPSQDELVSQIISLFEKYKNDLIGSVINGTGVILHTNLGRAPIDPKIYEHLKDAVCGYSNLEFDIEQNKRSKRGVMAGRMIAALSGAEAGMLVNNNAAAVYLIVANLAGGKEVIISRGQLVQIGGGFRIPEIIERSGAVLKEIGTTNKTSLADYRKAVNKNTGLILIVHKSNFIQKGFTEEPEPAKIVELAKQKKLPVCYDLGSGLLTSGTRFASLDEPDVTGAVKTGADLVCFSGDKLLGGPQAGLIVGRQRRISALLKDPIYRVIRPDKLTIGLMEKTLLEYLTGKSTNPCQEMASISLTNLKKRADAIVEALQSPDVRGIDLKSSFGGGSLPEYEFDSFGIKITGDAVLLSGKLRAASVPVISRSIASGVLIDLRTVFPDQDGSLIEAIRSCL